MTAEATPLEILTEAIDSQAGYVGLNAAEYRKFIAAKAELDKVFAGAVKRELAAGRDSLAQKVTASAEAAAEAERALRPGRAKIDGLAGELASTRRMIAEAQSPSEDQPLNERIRLRAARSALADEERELAQRIAMIEGMLQPLVAAASQARREAESASSKLAACDAAVAAPLGSAAGLRTRAGMTWLSLGTWISFLDPSVKRTIEGDAARSMIMTALQWSGIGEDIEQGIRDGMLAEQARKAGLTGSPAAMIASQPAADPSSFPPLPPHYDQQTAALETAYLRSAARAVGDPAGGMPVLEVRPMQAES